jgi:hypothetical protein
METRVLDDSAVAFFDLNRILEVACGKRKRMEKTVVGLGKVFADGAVVWRVAIIADSQGVVTGILPRVVRVLHHVTIHTTLRIIT